MRRVLGMRLWGEGDVRAMMESAGLVQVQTACAKESGIPRLMLVRGVRP